MRHEHQEIRRLLGTVREALASGEAGAARREIGALMDLLGEHNLKEEQVLYPASDAVAGSEPKREELVRAMQAL
jgi:hypothetical protein